MYIDFREVEADPADDVVFGVLALPVSVLKTGNSRTVPIRASRAPLTLES